MHIQSAVIAATGIAASPLIWNIVARNEYRRHTIAKRIGQYPGCYALAAWIFFSSLGRDALFQAAMQANKALTITSDAAAAKGLKAVGAALAAGGMTLVLAAYYRLGITGTYLGDYFGILMKERVTKFPFNAFENPMYLGSTACFLGMALSENSVVGVALAAWVHVVYHISTTYFENPFTTMIYAEAAKANQ